MKLPLSDDGGLLLLRLFSSKVSILCSRASIRSNNASTRSAIASGSSLASAISCSRVGLGAFNKASEACVHESTSFNFTFF